MTPFFFFTLSHTHCVSLYLFIRTAPLKLKLSLSLCLSLSRTHTKMAKKWLFVSALLLGPNGLSFLFLLFSSAYLTCLLSFALNQKLTLEAWGSKLINWALTNVTSKWTVPFRCHAPNNLPLQSTMGGDLQPNSSVSIHTGQPSTKL